MSTSTPNELTYLSEQRIGRPHVVPTGFNIDGEKGVAKTRPMRPSAPSAPDTVDLYDLDEDGDPKDLN